MIRFLKKSTHENMPGSEMQDVDCVRSNQLFVSGIEIGDPVKKATVGGIPRSARGQLLYWCLFLLLFSSAVTACKS